MSPRPIVRVDTNGTHDYALAARIDAGEPAVPYALHLTDTAQSYRYVVFDLDAARDGLAGVWRDAEHLVQLLDTHSLEHLVVRSGPGGGIHIWTPVSGEYGLDAAAVARLARAAVRRLPSLDIAPLLNPRTGAVRPPGAPHRAGGRAELLHPRALDDGLLVCDTPHNTAAKFEDLAVALGAEELDAAQETAAADTTARIDTAAERLRGRRAPMPDAVRHLLDHGPGDDPSAHLARILPRLALARWSLEDVRDLLADEPDAPGLEHLRTKRHGTRRRPLGGVEREHRLRRQWSRALAYAARLAPGTAAAERDLAELRETTARILDAVADPGLWTDEAGPADRLTLLGVARVALAAGVADATVDIDVRRLALDTGRGKSTAARALQRLRADGRIELVAAAEGTHAARWRLIHPDQWKKTPGDTGGTQGEPAPTGAGNPTAPVPTREDLRLRLEARLQTARHDVWAEHSPTHPRGLGRHLEQTYTALLEHGPKLYAVDPASVARYTGYTPARTARHLRILAEHDLIDPDTGLPTDASALDAAATRLGTTGVRAARERRYAAERAAHAAWHTELARLRAPVALRPRTAPAARYARTSGGDPDHAAQIARHLADAA